MPTVERIPPGYFTPTWFLDMVRSSVIATVRLSLSPMYKLLPCDASMYTYQPDGF
jgi:hypothetical protein